MTPLLIMIGLFGVIKFLDHLDNKTKKHRAYTVACGTPFIDENDLFFTGRSVDIDADHLHRTLKKRFPYYRQLCMEQQQQFRKRLRTFLRRKKFIIKDNEGFKEMPVLVSAAAIQLTFGLKSYLLPFYRFIRIYPEEYIAEHSFTILAGNVQNNVISVAWNQLLKGYDPGDDGSNLGLHEMSHALYIQKMVIEENYARNFSSRYTELVNECHEAYRMEIEGRKNLYSPYADTNLQEFWAESVEIFFEKPIELLEQYPDVFEALTILLNQDPRKKENPVLISNLSLKEKMEKIRKLVPAQKFLRWN